MTAVLLKSNRKSSSLDKCAGKWVALIGDKVIAQADTLEELEERIKKLKLKKRPVYFLVPRKDEGPYILRIFYEKRV